MFCLIFRLKDRQIKEIYNRKRLIIIKIKVCIVKSGQFDKETLSLVGDSACKYMAKPVSARTCLRVRAHSTPKSFWNATCKTPVKVKEDMCRPNQLCKRISAVYGVDADYF